jgi:16S rRNA processing protein RimM
LSDATDRPPAPRCVLLGKVVGVFGVQGEVKLESFTHPRRQIFKYRPWILKSAAGEREIAAASGREQGKGLVARLPGIDDRDAAAALIGGEIWVLRSALPRLKADEVYWTDLEGLAVVTTQGVSLGTVSHLFETGANDVLVARDGERERLIPYVLEQYVKSVDLDAGRVVVDWDPEF